MSDKYKFVKNCEIPEPPEAPIIVPNDSPINPLITLPPNPTIPLELIAKFLPCKYKGRFPCPEIKVENANDQQGGGGNSVTYNCLDKSELDVDFDIETYCCDVIEDQYGNEIDHDKIVLTSHSSLTLPYPDIIRKGWMHYLNTVAVAQFITNWNASHTNHIDACSRCWTPSILSQLYTYQTSIRNNLNDNDFVWYFYSKTIISNESPNRGYLLPLVDNEDVYVKDVELYEKEDPGLASLSLCKCTGTLLLRDEPVVQVMGMVRGRCNCSRPEVTSPYEHRGYYEWALDPADDSLDGFTPYNVDVNVPFWGYLSLQSGKVYASLPEQKDEIVTGVGTYNGNNSVDSVEWSTQNTGLPGSVRISSSNLNGEIPSGASVKIECSRNKCSGEYTVALLSAEYQRVRPATAQGAPVSGMIQVHISGAGSTPLVADAVCYCPNATSGTEGFVSYSNGSYHFFSRQASQEDEPVIRLGQTGTYSDLNGIGSIDESSELKPAEKNLPLYGKKFSTVLSRSDSGTATIKAVNSNDLSYYGTHADDGESKYWIATTIDGLRFNHDIDAVASTNEVYSENVVVADKSKTVKEIAFNIGGGTPIITKQYTKYTYDGYDVYALSADGFSGSYIMGSPVSALSNYIGGYYLTSNLEDTCDHTPITANAVTLAGSTYVSHHHTLSNNSGSVQLAYNPQVSGWEVLTNSSNLPIPNTYIFKSNTGLYYNNKVPLGDYYTLSTNQGNSYLSLYAPPSERTFTVKSLLTMKPSGTKPRLFRFSGGSMELVKANQSSSRFNLLKLTTPSDLNINLTFTLDTGDRSTFSDTPLNIFNNGLPSGKRFVERSSDVIVVDDGSYGEVPFTDTEKLLYYWEPNINIRPLSFTFRRYDKESQVYADSYKVCKLYARNYPTSYDSTLGTYCLNIGGINSSKCYRLVGNGSSLTESITFTFRKNYNVDTTRNLAYALQNKDKIRFNGSKVYTTANTNTYWTCDQLDTVITFEPTLQERIDLTDLTTGGFTGFLWQV